MSEGNEGWFVDRDPDADTRFPWVAVVQIDHCCIPLEVWHPTESAALAFARRVAGIGMLDEDVESSG